MLQNLEKQLKEVENTIKFLCDVEETNNLKKLKQGLIAADKVIDIFSFELSRIEQLRLSMATKLSSKLCEMKKTVQFLEEKFQVQKLQDNKPKKICVDIGGTVTVPAIFYQCRKMIPQLQYGAVRENGKTLLLYRYNNIHFVSCSLPSIVEFPKSGDKLGKSTCCVNEEACNFGESCRYFHDPAVSGNDDVQCFIRTQMARQCPFFGDRDMYKNQINNVQFKNIRTLARYCAIMTLLIHHAVPADTDNTDSIGGGVSSSGAGVSSSGISTSGADGILTTPHVV